MLGALQAPPATPQQLYSGRRAPSTARCRAPRSCPARASASSDKDVWLLDYGAGNVRSVRNAIAHLGYTVRDVASPADIARAPRLLFPGVGAFGTAMAVLKERGFVEPLKDYVQARVELCC